MDGAVPAGERVRDTMVRPVSSRHDVRFLGDTNTRQVHDLVHETRECHVAEILKAGNAVAFTPDLRLQANVEGYDNCRWCGGAPAV